MFLCVYYTQPFERVVRTYVGSLSVLCSGNIWGGWVLICTRTCGVSLHVRVSTIISKQVWKFSNMLDFSKKNQFWKPSHFFEILVIWNQKSSTIDDITKSNNSTNSSSKRIKLNKTRLKWSIRGKRNFPLDLDT